MTYWPVLGADLVPLAFAVRLGSVATSLALASRSRWCRLLAFSGSMVASALTGAAALAVLSGTPLQGSLFSHTASGLSFGYAVTPLSAWFLLVLAFLALPIAVYSVAYLGHGALDRRSAFVGVGFNFLLGAIEAVFVADGVIGFLFAWEAMSLASAGLVATEHERHDSRRAALTYLVMSHLGTGCLTAGFFTLASLSGSLDFSDVLSGSLGAGRLRDGLFVLFFIGFGVKAGAMPLHCGCPRRTPRRHPASRP